MHKEEEKMRFKIYRGTPFSAPAATIWIRIMVGGVFLSEGIQKFLYPAELAAGRFAKIGIPMPEFTGPLTGGVEIVCGALILAGLFTRKATVPLLTVMGVAMLSTKVPILLGREFMGFALRNLSRYGFWSMMHEARNDLCMIFGLLFLLCSGAGPLSLDAVLCRCKNEKQEPTG